MDDALLTGLGVAVGLVVGGFVVLSLAGVIVLQRRARRDAAQPVPGRTAAGAELLRADEAVRDAELELQFAVAQFGPDATRGFAEALGRARDRLREAYRLQQRLDDEDVGDRRRRDWVTQVRTSARRIQEQLEAERGRFEELRGAEADAPATIDRLRSALTVASTARDAAAGELAWLRQRYAAPLLDAVAGNPEEALAALANAERELAEAEHAVSSTRVTAVSGRLRAARETIARAQALADAVAHRRIELERVDAALDALRTESESRLAEARSLRDIPPDPDSAAVVGAAIAELERALADARPRGIGDPVAALDALVDASDALDVAVAAARNQRRRLDGAREALEGALVSARSQIAAVTDYIGSRRARVGVGARTRLAEAERELLHAEHEADPVSALDAARRAQTHARDADALARYTPAG